MTDDDIIKLAQQFNVRKTWAEAAAETVSYKFDAMGFARALLAQAAPVAAAAPVADTVRQHIEQRLADLPDSWLTAREELNTVLRLLGAAAAPAVNELTATEADLAAIARHKAELAGELPDDVPTVYVATLKSRQQIKAEIPREAQGWWADVCPGETLELRAATAADIARCHITEGQSRDPADYLCELPARGALVARIAIASIEAKRA